VARASISDLNVGNISINLHMGIKEEKNRKEGIAI